MSADEIEFYISDEPPEELSQREEIGGEPRRRPPLAFDRAPLVALLLLAAAAALPTVAAFQAVYTIRDGGGGVGAVSFGADGWGRYHEAASDVGFLEVPRGVHEIRYGSALVACAAVLALLGLALMVTLVVRSSSTPRRRVRTVGAPIAFAVTGLLGGVVASMWLHIQSEFDTLHAQVASSVRGIGGSPRVETGIGACPWLALAGAVAGLMAAGALWHWAKAESAAEEDPGKLA